MAHGQNTAWDPNRQVHAARFGRVYNDPQNRPDTPDPDEDDDYEPDFESMAEGRRGL